MNLSGPIGCTGPSGPTMIYTNFYKAREAIKENSDNYRYCSTKLKDNSQLVFLALSKDPYLIVDVPQRFREMKDIAKAYVSSIHESYSVFPPKFKEDEEFIKLGLEGWRSEGNPLTLSSIFKNEEQYLKLLLLAFFHDDKYIRDVLPHYKGTIKYLSDKYFLNYSKTVMMMIQNCKTIKHFKWDAPDDVVIVFTNV